MKGVALLVALLYLDWLLWNSNESLCHMDQTLTPFLLNLNAFTRRHNITLFLEGGTLLGAVREKRILEHELDLDLAIYATDFEKFVFLFEWERWWCCGGARSLSVSESLFGCLSLCLSVPLSFFLSLLQLSLPPPLPLPLPPLTSLSVPGLLPCSNVTPQHNLSQLFTHTLFSHLFFPSPPPLSIKRMMRLKEKLEQEYGYFLYGPKDYIFQKAYHRAYAMEWKPYLDDFPCVRIYDEDKWYYADVFCYHKIKWSDIDWKSGDKLAVTPEPPRDPNEVVYTPKGWLCDAIQYFVLCVISFFLFLFYSLLSLSFLFYCL